jgi:cytidine deaminase
MADGRIFTGCNVENASYGLSICAERVAITNAVASGQREIIVLAVVTESQAYPCGACLQFIQEFAGEESPIILTADLKGTLAKKTLSECLPCAFKISEANS